MAYVFYLLTITVAFASAIPSFLYPLEHRGIPDANAPMVIHNTPQYE